MQPRLPKDFLSLQQAAELINSDSRSNAKVDTKWMVNRLDWIEENHNFNIPLMKTLPDGRTVKCGHKYVEIITSYDREFLKKVIRDHYRDMVGREFEAKEVRSTSTIADEEDGGGNVRPRSRKPIAKAGQTITGETMTTNGADL